MSHIGVFGGHSAYPLGQCEEVVEFFKALNQLLLNDSLSSSQIKSLNGSLNSSGVEFDRVRENCIFEDRLFKRYLTEMDAEIVLEFVKVFNQRFVQDSDVLTPEIVDSSLNLSKINNFLSAVVKAIQSSDSFKKNFGIYQPVRIVRLDRPNFMIDRNRPLADYDLLKGEPFWLG